MSKHLVLCVALWGALSGTSVSTTFAAQESAKGGITVIPTLSGGGAISERSLIERYSKLAGSTENARSLINGLRHGVAITLTDTITMPPPPPSLPVMGPGGAPLPLAVPSSFVPAPTAAFSITFTPPTGPMGWGNVDITLALTEAVLTYQNIVSPNVRQLFAALMNSETGVLQLRSSGMGWPKIVTTLGFVSK